MSVECCYFGRLIPRCAAEASTDRQSPRSWPLDAGNPATSSSDSSTISFACKTGCRLAVRCLACCVVLGVSAIAACGQAVVSVLAKTESQRNLS